jgi:acyl-CoA reductase-like NAD-dependent aldehyde dehydrogenase
VSGPSTDRLPCSPTWRCRDLTDRRAHGAHHHVTRTGTTSPTRLSPTTDIEVDVLAGAAAEAFRHLAGWSRDQRAGLLETVAGHLEDGRAELVATADEETALGTARLDGELTRSIYQLQLFAEAVREGGYLEAAIDHGADTPLGPAPDVRRMLVPLGPVAVFGASNFPFAFSRWWAATPPPPWPPDAPWWARPTSHTRSPANGPSPRCGTA